MSTAQSSLASLTSRHQSIEAQNIQVKLDEKNQIIKLYCNNIFVGIALVEQNKGEYHLSPETKASVQVLTSSTETELLKAFQSVVSMSQNSRTQAIDQKLNSVMLFIDRLYSDDRLRPHITRCDVENLIGQIEKLERLAPPQDIKIRLKKCREIIAAFKIDKVLNQGPFLARNNEYNIRYYNDQMRDGFKVFEELKALLEKSEEGPVAVQLEDLERCGKIVREPHLSEEQLRHGNLVIFDKISKNSFGRGDIHFAVVDKLEETTALRIMEGQQGMIYVPKEKGVEFTRLWINGN